MREALEFVFESYTHFFGVVLLLWLMSGGIGNLSRIVVKAYIDTMNERKGK